MEWILLLWNYTTVLLFCGISLSVLILWRTNKKIGTNPNAVKTITFYHFLKSYFSSKDDVDVRRTILQIYSANCVLFDHEKFATFKDGWLKFAHFFKPDTVQVLLNNSAAIDKADEYRFLHPWLGTGLLTSSKDKWRSRRKLLTPAFHFSILKDFIPVFNEHSLKLVEKLYSHTERDWIDIIPVITLCTLDVICETAMGIRMHTQDGKCVEYVKAINEIANSFLNRTLNMFLWIDAIYFCLPQGRRFRRNLKHVHDFTRKVIKEKKELHEKNLSNFSNESGGLTKRKAFLELLLEHHYLDGTFTEEDIREEVDTFMFEGHDTTASAISWTIYCLGLYPEIQENVSKELKSIFQGDRKRFVTSEDLANMNYLERVIKETIRLYPPVPLVARSLKENIQVMGTTITTEFTCTGGIFQVHRDKEQFPNPEKFDPDRFLPDNLAKLHPYAYIPFSAGPRNCIGQRFALLELKTVLAHVIRNFKVISLDHRDKIRLMWGFVLKTPDPLRIKFVARSLDEI